MIRGYPDAKGTEISEAYARTAALQGPRIRLADKGFEQKRRKIGPCRSRLRMFASQTFGLAFQKFPLDGRRPFVGTLDDQNVPKCRNRAQPHLMVAANMPSQVRNRPFQHTVCMLDLAGLPIHDSHVGHQAEGLRMIRTEPALIRTERCEHGRKFGW